MRNWNCAYALLCVCLYARSQPTYEELKPCFSQAGLKTDQRFSAYLWGIETVQIPFHLVYLINRSQPTYEELKPLSRSLLAAARFLFSAYLWGIETQILFTFPVTMSSCSQPTYEELKLYTPPVSVHHIPAVLSLPMRNWNTRMTNSSSCSPSVLSLPMRNWNVLRGWCFKERNRFSAYLWGIETKFRKPP